MSKNTNDVLACTLAHDSL